MSNGSTIRGIQALVSDAQSQVGAAKENLAEAVRYLIEGLEGLNKEISKIDPEQATKISKSFNKASDYIEYATGNLNDLEDR